LPKISAIPESRNTCPKIPPAPVINNMEEALTKAFPIHPSMENMAPSNFLGRVKDKKHPINNAMNGVPKKVKILINIGKESYSSGLYPYTDVNNELITIKMMGT